MGKTWYEWTASSKRNNLLLLANGKKWRLCGNQSINRGNDKHGWMYTHRTLLCTWLSSDCMGDNCHAMGILYRTGVAEEMKIYDSWDERRRIYKWLTRIKVGRKMSKTWPWSHYMFHYTKALAVLHYLCLARKGAEVRCHKGMIQERVRGKWLDILTPRTLRKIATKSTASPKTPVAVLVDREMSK